MKRFSLTFYAMLFVCFSYCQTKQTDVIVKDTVNVYKLYPTKNIWTFIKLNTSNGQMNQVHFSLNDSEEQGELILSIKRLAFGKDAVNGRFELYPTENMYNFILLDKIDGRTWQVQWSFDVKNRGIIPLSEY